MPSDVKRAAAATGDAAQTSGDAGGAANEPLVEPPSAKLIARLFIIPLIIVAAAVGIMFLIGRMAGANPSFEDALQRLRNPGGERTVDLLIGPGSKQRYMDAKTVADKIMKVGADPAERVKISDELIEIVDKHTTDKEGDVRHFLLLALGRAWQLDQPGAGADSADSAEAAEARQRALAALLRYANSDNVSNQKAAILALAYWAGRMQASVERSPVSSAMRSMARRAQAPMPSSCPRYRSVSRRGYSMRATTSAAWARLVPGAFEAAISASTSSLRISNHRIEGVERQLVQAADDEIGADQFPGAIARGDPYTA
jgi:hypothetical protein